MTFDELKESIQEEIEWLETTDRDVIQCISIENLEAILSVYFNTEIKLTKEEN